MLLTAVLAACAQPAASRIPVATAACAAPSFPPLQGGLHLLGDEPPPVPYSSVPGTSGWHSSGQPVTGVVTEPLPEAELVLTMEVGQIVVTYAPDALPAEDIEQLRALATGPFDGQLTVVPFHGDMGAPLVVNGWGVRQPCTAIDETAIGTFVAAFAARAPGPDSQGSTP